jgi:hypothetical protein
MLGADAPLKWEAVGKGFTAEIPPSVQKQAPGKYAWTIKISKISK